MVGAASPHVVGNVFTVGDGERSVENNVTDIIVYTDVGALSFNFISWILHWLSPSY